MEKRRKTSAILSELDQKLMEAIRQRLSQEGNVEFTMRQAQDWCIALLNEAVLEKPSRRLPLDERSRYAMQGGSIVNFFLTDTQNQIVREAGKALALEFEDEGKKRQSSVLSYMLVLAALRLGINRSKIELEMAQAESEEAIKSLLLGGGEHDTD